MIWAADKIKHYQKGFEITRIPSYSFWAITIMACIPFFEILWWIPVIFWIGLGLVLTFVAGGKELIYDKSLGKGKCEMNDFIATLIGGLDGICLWKKSKF